MPFPYSLTIATDASGPAAKPHATGGLAAALAATLRAEECQVDQSDPVTCTFRTPGLLHWGSRYDPLAYVSTGHLHIEATATDLRVHLTVRFGPALFLAVAFGVVIGIVGHAWVWGTLFTLVTWGLVYGMARLRLPGWLRDVTRRSDVEPAA